MKLVYFFLVASIGIFAACSSLNEKTVLEEGELVVRVIFEAPVIRSLGEEDETRASLNQEGEGSIRFAWQATDTVGICPNKGAQAYFEMTDGVGTNVASFDGGGWDLKKGATYSCYFPFVGNIYLKRETIPVSFTNQEQNGISNFDGVKFYLASEGTSSSAGALRFSFQMLNTVIRIKAIGLPAGTYTKLTLTTVDDMFVQEGTFGLDDMEITGRTYSNTLELSLNDVVLTETSTEANPVLFYLTSAPVDLSGKTVVIRVYSEDGSIFTCEKTPGKAYGAGAWGGLKCEMNQEGLQPNNEIWYTTRNQSVYNFETGRQFGTTFVSNTYEDGKGIIRFEGPVTMIAEKAFSGAIFSNSDVTSLTLPNSVRELGAKALYGLKNLESLSLPNGLLFIQNFAISGCNALTTLAIPESVVDIASGAIVGCSSLEGFSGKFVSDDNRYIIINNEIRCFAGGNLSDTNITIPGDITSIGSAFRGSSITGITLNSIITEIDDLAFFDCGQLETVSFLCPLSLIGNQAFDYCYKLRSFIGPNASTDGRMIIIDDVACAFAMTYTSFTLPEGVINLDYYSVYNIAQNGIKELSFPSTINSDSYLYLPDLVGLERISFSLATIPDLNLPVNSSRKIEIDVPICMVDAYESVLGDDSSYYYNVIGDITRMKNNIFYSTRMNNYGERDSFSDDELLLFDETDFGANALTKACIHYESNGIIYDDVLIQFDSDISRISANARVFESFGPYIDEGPYKIWIPETVIEIEEIATYYNNNDVYIYFLGNTPPSIIREPILSSEYHLMVPQQAINKYQNIWPSLANSISGY